MNLGGGLLFNSGGSSGRLAFGKSNCQETMTPELQALLQQAQQAQQHALTQTYFLGYTTFACIVVCALFSTLIFWKLCQIQKTLGAAPRSAVSAPQQQTLAAAACAQGSTAGSDRSKPQADESRYMPKG